MPLKGFLLLPQLAKGDASKQLEHRSSPHRCVLTTQDQQIHLTLPGHVLPPADGAYHLR